MSVAQMVTRQFGDITGYIKMLYFHFTGNKNYLKVQIFCLNISHLVANIRTMYKRNITANLKYALSDTPVVLLNGARQTGKSTLVQWLSENEHPARYITMDDSNILSAAIADPAGFLAGFQGPLIIDEIQRSPELFLAIKSVIDKKRKSGQYLLTGSANVLLLPKLADTLAGRMETISLWPFSQGEIESTKEHFVDRLFLKNMPKQKFKAIEKSELLTRILCGGFPEVIKRASLSRRKAWFSSYITTILQRDIRDLSRIEGMATIPRLLSVLGARACSVINISELSRTAGIPLSTLKRYIILLEATFLLTMLPAWSGNFTKRLVKSPKIIINDTGLLGHLIGLDKRRLNTEPELLGPLLENFVVMELIKQISWSINEPKIFHFRTQTGKEVDIVLEDAAGQIVGIEVKSSYSVKAGDFGGLKTLAAETGKNFKRGVVLYTGQEYIPFGKKMFALPISAIWSS